MDKIPFPYTNSCRTYFLGSLPLDEFCAIYLDHFVDIDRSPFFHLDEISFESKMVAMELISFQLAVSLNVMVAGMERALERLDAEMYKLLNGKANFNWPKKAQSGWPEIPNQKPFGFFYYKLDKVIDHWKNIFSVDLRPLNFDQIYDFVQFRHVWSHSAGFVNASGSKKFKYYKVDTNRTLLPSYDVYKEAFLGIWKFVNHLNDKIGVLVLKKYLDEVFEKTWEKDKSQFIVLLNCFSWFGSLKKTDEIALKIYNSSIAGKFSFENCFD